MSILSPSASSLERDRSGEGYRYFLCSTSILVGSIHLALSLIALTMPILPLPEPSVKGHFQFADLIGFYLGFQIWTGWFVGGLAIVAGVLARNGRHRKLLLWSAILHLLHLPLGTTVGILILAGLGRPSMRRAFVD